MKYYEYEGKVYKSRNRETLARRLFSTTVNAWGEKIIANITAKTKKIKCINKCDI